jgi:hypothetical protein
LKRATLIKGGRPIDVVNYAAGQTAARFTAPVNGSTPGWFALTVEDAKGMTAYTDPIWVATAP